MSQALKEEEEGGYKYATQRPHTRTTHTKLQQHMIDGLFFYENKTPLLLFPVNGADLHDLQSKIKQCGIEEREFDWKGPVEISSSQAVMVRQYGKLLIFAPFGAGESPLMIEELMSKILEVLESFFRAPLSPRLVVDKKSDVVLVLSEMIDTGIPRITEPNIIEHLLRKDGLLTQLFQQATSTSAAAGSTVPLTKAPQGPQQVPDKLVPWENSWRRPKVTYAKEELFVDIIEHVRWLRKSSSLSKPILLHIRGEIRLTSRLSDEPKVVDEMKLPAKLSQIQVHPCVDTKALESSASQNYTFSMIPPDLKSCVARYTLKERENGPLTTNLTRGRDYFEITLSTAIDVKIEHLDNLTVFIVFPPGTRSVKELSSTGGDLDVSNPQRCLYHLGKSVPMGWRAQLKAQGLTAAGEVVQPIYAELHYSLLGKVPSAAEVRRINISPQKFKSHNPPFKGVRYQTNVEAIIS